MVDLGTRRRSMLCVRGGDPTLEKSILVATDLGCERFLTLWPEIDEKR